MSYLACPRACSIFPPDWVVVFPLLCMFVDDLMKWFVLLLLIRLLTINVNFTYHQLIDKIVNTTNTRLDIITFKLCLVINSFYVKNHHTDRVFWYCKHIYSARLKYKQVHVNYNCFVCLFKIWNVNRDHLKNGSTVWKILVHFSFRGLGNNNWLLVFLDSLFLVKMCMSCMVLRSW